jgi:hypothetical protein
MLGLKVLGFAFLAMSCLLLFLALRGCKRAAAAHKGRSLGFPGGGPMNGDANGPAGMSEDSKVRLALARLRACTVGGKWADQDIRKWKGPFPLPELLRTYFSPLGPKDAVIPSVVDPLMLFSLKEARRWKGGKTVLSESAREAFWPVVLVEGESDDVFWCDVRTPRCPVYHTEAGFWREEGDPEYEQVASGLGDFLLALCVVAEAVGPDWVGFNDRYLVGDEAYGNEECRRTFLPRLTEILGSSVLAQRFYRIFFGEPDS